MKIEELEINNCKITNYDYSNLSFDGGQSCTLQGLIIEYKTKTGKDKIDIGDIPFSYYFDCGDVCIEYDEEYSYIFENVDGLCKEIIEEIYDVEDV